MNDPHSFSSTVYQGGDHFEFSSEKHWNVEQSDCKIFDSIDMAHLATSLASVPFNIQHDIPAELFTLEQLEEFEVESSLALNRHTLQCETKLLSTETVLPISIGVSQASTDTNKSILNNLSKSEKNNDPFDCETQTDVKLEEILGNMKPLINILQDEINTVSSIDASEANPIKVENQNMIPIKVDSKIEITNHDSGHWLDSMLDSDE